MCGRFTLASEPSEVAEVLPGLTFERAIEPRYNIAPSQMVASVLNNADRVLTFVRWGLVPAWAKDPAIGNRMINARAETLVDKPSFRMPLRRQRCLILADGFYEWRRLPGQRARVPVYFRLTSRKPFAFAGLWDRWRDPTGGPLTTVTIITTTPNTLVAEVHNRMPAILRPEMHQRWLAREEQSPELLLPCLGPYPAQEMDCHPVSTLVNNPKIDEAKCVEPLDQPPP